MTIDDKVSDEKQQYDINREAANISELINMNILHIYYLYMSS